jgi:hypothetical protein
MATIRGFVERFKSINFKEVTMDSFIETNEVVIEKNLDQLGDGKSKNGTPLKKYASDNYAVFKHRLNPSPGLGNPDLKLTGKYWDGWFIKQTGETQYEMGSTDSKAAYLDAHYNKEQYGLDSDSRANYIKEDYLPILTKNVRKKVYNT